MGEKRGLEILEHGQLREDVGALERAADPHAADAVRRRAGDVAAVEHDLAAIRLQMPGDQVEQASILPAPLGPITAAIWRVSTVRLTSLTATKAGEGFAQAARPQASARDQPPAPTGESGDDPADDAAGKDEQQHQQDRAEHERPILGVVGDLLVEPDQRRGADRRSPEIAHAAEDRHDHDLGRFRPEHIIGEDAAAEDAVERAGKPGKGAGDDKGGELIGAHVDADKGGALGIVADRRQHAAERRAHDPVQHRQRHRHQHQGQQVEAVADAQIAEAGDRRHPVEIGIGDLRQALVAAGHVVPFVADRPDDLRKRQGQHREIELDQAHAEIAGDQGEQPAAPSPAAGKATMNGTP